MISQTKPRLVSLLSQSYSGATLFCILLDRHPEISCDGETFPFEALHNVACTCGSQQICCQYYRTAAAHMLNEDGHSWNYELFSHVPLYSQNERMQNVLAGLWSYPALNLVRNVSCRMIPSVRKRETRFIEAHEQFIGNSLRIKSASVYIDGSKNYRRASLFAASRRFRMQAIYLIRDGRAFCNSYIKNKKVGKAGLPEAAQRWLQNIREADLFCQRFPDIPLQWIRYETLCHDLPGTLQRIKTFLGLRSDFPEADEEGVTQHVLGNRMRMGFTGQVQEDLSWKSELASADIAWLNQRLRGGLERFEYLEDNPALK